jgi:hypothetical protein
MFMLDCGMVLEWQMLAFYARGEIKMVHTWESLRHKASAEKRKAGKKEAVTELKRILAEAGASSVSGTTPP